MKKCYLLFLTLLYVAISVSSKAAEESSGLQEKAFSLINKSEAPIYLIFANGKDYVKSALVFSGHQQSADLFVGKPLLLCIWKKNLEKKLSKNALNRLKETVRENLAKGVSQIDFEIKPDLFLQTFPKFNKTIRLNFTTKGNLEPQKGSPRSGNIKQDDINNFMFIFDPEKNNWVESKDASSQSKARIGSISRFRGYSMKQEPEPTPQLGDNFELTLQNEDQNPIFVIVTDSEGMGAKLLEKDKSFFAEFSGDHSTKMYIWDSWVGSELENERLKKLVKSNLNLPIEKADFIINFPTHFIEFPKTKASLFLEWKKGTLQPQKRKKGQNSLTKEYISNKLLRRTENDEWLNTKELRTRMLKKQGLK